MSTYIWIELTRNQRPQAKSSFIGIAAETPHTGKVVILPDFGTSETVEILSCLNTLENERRAYAEAVAQARNASKRKTAQRRFERSMRDAAVAASKKTSKKEKNAPSKRKLESSESFQDSTTPELPKKLYMLVRVTNVAHGQHGGEYFFANAICGHMINGALLEVQSPALQACNVALAKQQLKLHWQRMEEQAREATARAAAAHQEKRQAS